MKINKLSNNGERSDYTIETKLSVQEVVDKLQAKLKENNFGVLHIYNLKDIFKSKGIEFGEYQIFSVCNPKFAKEAGNPNFLFGITKSHPFKGGLFVA